MIQGLKLTTHLVLVPQMDRSPARSTLLNPGWHWRRPCVPIPGRRRIETCTTVQAYGVEYRLGGNPSIGCHPWSLSRLRKQFGCCLGLMRVSFGLTIRSESPWLIWVRVTAVRWTRFRASS